MSSVTSCHSERNAFVDGHLRHTDESLTLARALKETLPRGVQLAAAEVSVGLDAPSALAEHRASYPDEAALVCGAVPTRLFELLATRQLARGLLLEMGERAVSIPRGAMGAPEWPAGIVGSMAHSHGMVVVAVARTKDYLGLGVDLEPDRPLSEEVLCHVSLPGENDGAPASRALFVAKEAFYKAHSVIHHRMLDFLDVRVTWQPGGFGVEEISPPIDGIGPTSSSGTLSIVAGWLVAICAIRQGSKDCWQAR
jgi:4'-phosphopantetheinyl transferase EntD